MLWNNAISTRFVLTKFTPHRRPWPLGRVPTFPCVLGNLVGTNRKFRLSTSVTCKKINLAVVRTTKKHDFNIMYRGHVNACNHAYIYIYYKFWTPFFWTISLHYVVRINSNVTTTWRHWNDGESPRTDPRVLRGCTLARDIPCWWYHSRSPVEKPVSSWMIVISG